MHASQRLSLKIHKAIAETAGGDLVGYSVYRALRLEATQIAPLLFGLEGEKLHAEVFARQHGDDKLIAKTRQMFLKALGARSTLGQEYEVSVHLKSRGVTQPPIVTGINLWDTDPLNKIRITL